MPMDILPDDDRAELAEMAVRLIQWWLDYGDETQKKQYETQELCRACRLLGGLGNMTHAHILEDILRNDYVAGAHEQAAAALRLIQDRECRFQVDDHIAECDVDASLGPARTSDQPECEQGGQMETEVQLYEAIVQSEQDALQQEQAHVHEAILLSKLKDLPPKLLETCADRRDRLVLLTFTRCPQELRQALLASELAAELVNDGVELEPEYAGGRLVLAEGVTATILSEAREPWHVVVCVADEERVYAAIKHGLRSQSRPKLKGIGGRILIPGDDSWFNDASKESEESSSAGGQAFAQLSLEDIG